MSTKPDARLGTFKRPNGTAVTFTAWRKGRVLIQYERYEPGYPFPVSVEKLADVEREDLATFPQWLKQFLPHVENRESVDKDHRIRKEEPGYANIRLSSYATGTLFITVWQRNSPRNPDIFALTATEVRELIQLLENITKDENAMSTRTGITPGAVIGKHRLLKNLDFVVTATEREGIVKITLEDETGGSQKATTNLGVATTATIEDFATRLCAARTIAYHVPGWEQKIQLSPMTTVYLAKPAVGGKTLYNMQLFTIKIVRALYDGVYSFCLTETSMYKLVTFLNDVTTTIARGWTHANN